ncbi:MAG: restriction endonuclease [Chitinophagaceae bacterium]
MLTSQNTITQLTSKRTVVDLNIDTIFKGGKRGNAGDDPISKILKCGNQAGFRYSGSYKDFSFPYIVLYSSFNDYDWPDSIDFHNGIFTYNGDNKKAGLDIHDTERKGNLILQRSFDLLHSKEYSQIKPFFVFGKGYEGRDVIFRGIAVPGGIGYSSTDDLTAIWKYNANHRFQNYRAIFTILDIPTVKAEWISDLESGKILTDNTPKPYLDFARNGKYTPLISERSLPIRLRHEQLPSTYEDLAMLKAILDFFAPRPHDFELFAADITRMFLSNVVEIDVTRPWRDGGRDALGKYRIGSEESFILVDFAMEAKCYDFSKSSVGVREVSRLISRIRNRQFGVLVTTSFVAKQAYEEVVIDGHPIIFLTGRDIVDLLKRKGYTSVDMVLTWIRSNFTS